MLAALLALVVTLAPSAAAASPARVETPRIERLGTITVVTPSCGAAPCRPIHTEEQVRRWLRGCVGERYDAEKILGRIERHYDYLGYEPRISSQLEDGALNVKVLEAVAGVAAVAADPSIARPAAVMRSVRTRSGDVANESRQARDEYALSRIGYDLLPSPAASPPGAGPEDPEPPETLGVVRRGQGIEGAGPLRRQWYDGEAEYTRRDLFVGRFYYTRAALFREFDELEVSPYVSRRPAGAVAYTIPWLLPASVTAWNLYARIRLYDEFTPDRVLGGVQTDEERVGGSLALGVEPFRHLSGHSLRVTAFTNRYHIGFGRFTVPISGGIVRSDEDVPRGRLNDVHLIGLAGDYTYEHVFRSPSFSWRFLPMVEIARPSWGGDIAFRRYTAELQQHYAFSTGLEIDASWKAGVVDRRVPLFEQFSLGGPDTLRGFIRDDFLGRRLLSARNDLWIPVPFRAFGKDSRLLAVLQRNLKTAITFDVGSVSFEEAREVHLARGMGVGLRYAAEKSPTLYRLDIAYGYWQGVTRWYPYVSYTRRW